MNRHRHVTILDFHESSDPDDDCLDSSLGIASEGWETIPPDFAEQLAHASPEDIARKYWAAATAPRLRMFELSEQKQIELPEACLHDAVGRRSVLEGRHRRRSELLRQWKREEYSQSDIQVDDCLCACAECAEQGIH